MAFSLNAFDQQYGTSTQHAAGNTAWTSSAPPAAAPKAPNFFSSVAKSAMAIPGQVAGAVAGSVVKSFHDVAGGISEALTAGRQNQANDQYRQAIEDAGQRYHQLYTSGKMSKAQYTKLSQGLIKQSQDLSGQIGDQVSQMVAPKDFATGLATVGSLPFAFGSLTPETGALSGATKVLGASGKTDSALTRIAKAPVKFAAIDQPVAQAPVQIGSDLKSGNVAGAAGNAALLAAPGAIGLAGKVAKTVAPILKEAAFGKSAVLTDALGDRVIQYAKDNPDRVAELKQMELLTKDQAKRAGQTQGDTFAEYMAGKGVDTKTAPINDILDHFSTYAKQYHAVQGGIKQGILPKTAVVSADFRDAIPKVSERIKALGNVTPGEQLAEANRALNELGIKNPTVRNVISDGLLNGGSVKDVESLLEHQKAVIPTPGGMLDKGFIATYGPNERATLPTLSQARSAGAPEFGKAANPVLGAITGGLRKAGLGLEDYNPRQIGMAKDNFTKAVDDMKLPLVDGKDAYEALSKLAEEKHLLDPRQLRAGEIEQTLGLSSGDAKKVLSAAKSMYDGVPLSVRGAAGKLQDANLKLNPLAAPYSRIQTRLRYDLNPAFRAQQKIEAATLGQVVTGGHNPTGDVTKTLNIMRGDGFLPTSTSFTGEALHDVKGATNVTTHLTLDEEKSLAHVLEATAAKNGNSVADELKNESTRQLMRAIVQNPKQGILSSNFAKATNMLFFPSAYNAKVTGMALGALAKQPPAVQFGVIKNINDFHNWTKTDEGVKWQRDNSELLGLVSYFTPINSVQQIMSAIGDKNPRELGLIGGLPFGVIQRVLEGQGAIPKSTPPYVDPKTGQIVPDKIPQSDKARLQQGLGDILDTMFTFPGRTAGFGSKTDLRNTLTGGLLKPNPSEVKSVTRTDLTPDQRNNQRVLAPPARTQPALPATSKSVKTFSGAPTVAPIYKGGSKPKRGKTLAKRIGQPF